MLYCTLRTVAIFFTFFCYSTLLALAAPVPLTKRTTHVGRGTWFHPGEGNCGYQDSDNDPVVAIGIGLYNANGGANCNQWLQITNTANGNVAYGQTRDSCESCDDDSLDMSPSLFQQLAPYSTGQITISWNFEPMGWSPP